MIDLKKAFLAALENGQLNASEEAPMPFFLLRAMRHLVSTSPIVHSQAAHIDQLIHQLPKEYKAKALSQVPLWFEEYENQFLDVSLEQLHKLGATDELALIFQSSDPTQTLMEETKRQFAENAREIPQLLASKKQPDISKVSPADIEKIGLSLSMMRASLSKLRCLGTYGQSMGHLINAGSQGNDEGFRLALTIDHAVLGHPAVVARIASATVAKDDEVIESFHNAARNGPSKKIAKELNECRLVLGMLRQLNFLSRLSPPQLYQLLCEDLQVYPVTGKDPAAGLKAFIQRWEEALVQ